jgi:hypothetical protein
LLKNENRREYLLIVIPKPPILKGVTSFLNITHLLANSYESFDTCVLASETGISREESNLLYDSATAESAMTTSSPRTTYDVNIGIGSSPLVTSENFMDFENSKKSLSAKNLKLCLTLYAAHWTMKWCVNAMEAQDEYAPIG